MPAADDCVIFVGPVAGGAATTTQPAADDCEAPVAPPEPEPDVVGRKTKARSTLDQVGLVLWKIRQTKRRSARDLTSQLGAPALWFVVVWLLYIFMGKTFFTNYIWNKKHWNYDAKGGKLRDYDDGDVISHGFLEVYVAQFAFVPLMQAALSAPKGASSLWSVSVVRERPPRTERARESRSARAAIDRRRSLVGGDRLCRRRASLEARRVHEDGRSKAVRLLGRDLRRRGARPRRLGGVPRGAAKGSFTFHLELC